MKLTSGTARAEENYWSNFEQRYPNSVKFIWLGVWNTSYYINSRNIDHYPLIAPFVPVESSKQSDSTSKFSIPLTLTSVAVVAISLGLFLYFKKRNH
jgi:hypothetical protein